MSARTIEPVLSNFQLRIGVENVLNCFNSLKRGMFSGLPSYSNMQLALVIVTLACLISPALSRGWTQKDLPSDGSFSDTSSWSGSSENTQKIQDFELNEGSMYKITIKAGGGGAYIPRRSFSIIASGMGGRWTRDDVFFTHCMIYTFRKKWCHFEMVFTAPEGKFTIKLEKYRHGNWASGWNADGGVFIDNIKLFQKN